MFLETRILYMINKCHLIIMSQLARAGSVPEEGVFHLHVLVELHCMLTSSRAGRLLSQDSTKDRQQSAHSSAVLLFVCSSK